MKRQWMLLVIVSALLSGCALYDNTDIIVIDCVSKGVILANGKKFPLQSKEDGGRIIEAFPHANQIRIRNVQNALFSDVWKIVDYHNSHSKTRTPLSYEILLSSGKAKEIKFFGRASDPLWMGRIDTQTPIDVNDDCLLDAKEIQQGAKTYLQIWCKISSAKGRDILKIIEMYLSHTGDANDVYLLPY